MAESIEIVQYSISRVFGPREKHASRNVTLHTKGFKFTSENSAKLPPGYKIAQGVLVRVTYYQERVTRERQEALSTCRSRLLFSSVTDSSLSS